jgi:D-3-phosphoglycerate dehydrogenase
MSVIFSTHPLHPEAEAMLAHVGELRVASAPDGETLLREGRGADIIIVRAPVPPAYFVDNPSLRAAIRHGAGLDMIPYEVATAAGVLIANVPGVNARTVAEHVFLMTLALLRRFRAIDRDLREEGWASGRAHADHASDLSGRKIGIVGMGNVGRAIFQIARHGFGLDVLASSRTPASLPDGARHVGLDELMGESDVVVLCCPLTPETTGLISRARIGMMKKGSLLINVARGPVVDNDALLEALTNKMIGGAALDVFPVQPLPSDHPYLQLDNVIVTPHLAGITEDSMQRMGTGVAAEVARVLADALPVNLRNPEAVEHYRRRFRI